MVYDRGIEWGKSAGKHGFTLDDVLFATAHATKYRQYTFGGEEYVKLTGPYCGDSLVHSIEVIMKQTGSGRIVVFHVNVEQQGFWETD